MDEPTRNNSDAVHIIDSNLTKSLTPITNTGMLRTAINYSTVKTSKQHPFLGRNPHLDNKSGENIFGK